MSINIKRNQLKRVVIVGGGLGGLRLAEDLCNSNLQVVLIDKNNFHQFPPLIYQIASAGIDPSSISFPFRQIFRKRKNFYFRMAEARAVFPDKKILQTSIGKIEYDYLVFAAGTTTNFYGNANIEKWAIPMKTVSEAMGLRNAVLSNLERALTCAYDEVANGTGFNEEFAYSNVEVELMKKYLTLADKLHTDLHECLGHASGQMLPGVDASSLKNYRSTLEEARADLFALYHMADPKLLELGIFKDADTYKAEYYKYIMNGLLTQLTRIEPGKDIEEAHMRNRKLISEWCYQEGKADNVIEYVKRDGKTFVRINDYEKLHKLFGKLLAEIQRIKSEGDFEAGRDLVETYGVKVDPAIHKEILARYEKLNIAPYKGFVNPVYTLVKDNNGNITDVKISYEEGYIQQMLRYSRDYSPLTK